MIDRISAGRRRKRSVDGGSFAKSLLLSCFFFDMGMVGDPLRKSDRGEAVFCQKEVIVQVEKSYGTMGVS